MRPFNDKYFVRSMDPQASQGLPAFASWWTATTSIGSALVSIASSMTWS